MSEAPRIDHVAFRTRDTRATHDFYVNVMGWPLRAAFGKADADPPWFITGYDTGSFLVEFEEEVGVDGDRVADRVFPHLGIDVGMAEALDEWRARLDAHGVPHATFGDDLWLLDPNGIKLQLFVKRDQGTDDPAAALEGWLSR